MLSVKQLECEAVVKLLYILMENNIVSRECKHSSTNSSSDTSKTYRIVTMSDLIESVRNGVELTLKIEDDGCELQDSAVEITSVNRPNYLSSPKNSEVETVSNKKPYCSNSPQDSDVEIIAVKRPYCSNSPQDSDVEIIAVKRPYCSNSPHDSDIEIISITRPDHSRPPPRKKQKLSDGKNKTPNIFLQGIQSVNVKQREYPSGLHPKSVLNNISGSVMKNLRIDMNLKYDSTKSENEVWVTILSSEWPTQLRTVGMGRGKKLSQIEAAVRLVHILKEKNIVSTTGKLISTDFSSVTPNTRQIIFMPDLKESSKTNVGQPLKIVDNSCKLQNPKLVPVSVKRSHCSSSPPRKRKKLPVSDRRSAVIPADFHLEESDTINIPESDLVMVSTKFPQPVQQLNDIYMKTAKELNDKSYKPNHSFHEMQPRTGRGATRTMWKCTYMIKWPNERIFSAIMSSKKLARREVALKILYWLQTQDKLADNGCPVMYDKNEVEELSKLPPEISIDPGLHSDMDTLISCYKKDIEPVLDEWQLSNDQTGMVLRNQDTTEELFGTEEITHPIIGSRAKYVHLQEINKRNLELHNSYVQRISSENFKKPGGSVDNLPIAEYKDQILHMVEKNPVIVIKGETGCGKSTQVPQYLMEQFEASKQGAHCNIIISQPRRISAITLAEWVACQRQEKVGDVVGYQVRLRCSLPRSAGGTILFCSTGIMLRKLQNNPGLFGASHAILDEAHERLIDTDLLLVLLRRAVLLNPQLRVIVMSATINVELFQNYFNNAPVFHVQGFTHPVKSFFLDHLIAENANIDVTKLHNNLPLKGKEVANAIHWVAENRPEGAILCFLPGWTEISNVKRHLSALGSWKYIILPAHSRLSYAEQRQIFCTAPPGMRKIILATNIAETSLTIDDVVYVVDTGRHKEQRSNLELGITTLCDHWISKANVNQRKGRAGRVQPGECYHLYSKEKYESLDQFPIPEILRVPLEKTVLGLKTYSQEQKAAVFLSEMPEPPSPDSVNHAVGELIHLGALDERERLTPLGRRIAMFTTHPKLSKALILASIFRCVAPIVTITTLLSNDVEIIKDALRNKGGVRAVKRCYHPSSDHAALALLYQEWEVRFTKSKEEASSLVSRNCLTSANLDLASKLRKITAEHLCHSRMLSELEDYKHLNAACNKYAMNDEMVKAVFFSGTDTLLFRRSWEVKKGCLRKNANFVSTEGGQEAAINSESVNFKRTDFNGQFLTCFQQMQFQEQCAVNLRETSLLSSLSVLLFSTGQLSVQEPTSLPSSEGKWDNHVLLKINRKKDLLMICENSQAQRLVEFRAILWKLVNYFVVNEGVERNQERYERILEYHKQFLKTLSKMMFSAEERTEL